MKSETARPSTPSPERDAFLARAAQSAATPAAVALILAAGARRLMAVR